MENQTLDIPYIKRWIKELNLKTFGIIILTIHPRRRVKNNFEIIFSKTEEERFRMGIQMMEDTRQMVMNGIRKQNPGISEADLKIAFINRYYKNDLSEEYLKDVAQWIRTKYP